jgi:hypothetical protein
MPHERKEVRWEHSPTPNTPNMRGHNNIESPIKIVVQVIQMDDKLFKWMTNCSHG